MKRANFPIFLSTFYFKPVFIYLIRREIIEEDMQPQSIIIYTIKANGTKNILQNNTITH